MPYKTIKGIGKGGFGIVDKVQDEHGQFFARKTFSSHQISNWKPEEIERILKRFEREATIQTNIQHRNVVPILFCDLETNPPYYVMPIALASLEDDIDGGILSDEQKREAILDILSGLEELHSLGLTHRDLKPGNVLRFTGEPLNDKDYYAIGDFGLASISETSVTTLTTVGMRMRSDMYTAPEITHNLKLGSPQSDIFSVGCIIHDLFGRLPRQACNEILEEGRYEQIWSYCTKNKPEKRFQNVGSLREAFLLAASDQDTDQIDEGFDSIFSKETQDITLKDFEKIVWELEKTRETNPDHPLFYKISLEFLKHAKSLDTLLAIRLGKVYSNWVATESFSFGSCDTLANKVEAFMDLNDVELNVECLKALLFLGTNHNRYYVERKFQSIITSKTVSSKVLARLAIEIGIDFWKFSRAFHHIKSSIGFQWEYLPTELLNALKKKLP